MGGSKGGRSMGAVRNQLAEIAILWVQRGAAGIWGWCVKCDFGDWDVGSVGWSAQGEE